MCVVSWGDRGPRRDPVAPLAGAPGDGRHNQAVKLGTTSVRSGHTDPVAEIIEDLGDDVFHVDTRMGGYEGITSGYLIRSSRPCLVETGTARSAELVVRALAELGVDAADLATIVVTHIHLDHAGGVGDIAAAFPNAQVVVHEKGARHLADPSRLMASAHRVFGEDMDRLFGDLLPVPQERLVVLGEVGTIDLGDGRRLDAFHNPGHASHHVGLLDSETGDLYTGDAAGVYVPETADVRPATPPPDFDLDLTLSSLAADEGRRREPAAVQPLRACHRRRRHPRPIRGGAALLGRGRRRRACRRARTSTTPSPWCARRTANGTRVFYEDEARVLKFDELSGVGANVNGIVRWLDKRADAGA